MAKNFPSSFLICFLGNELQVDTLIIDFQWYEDHQDQMAQFQELSRVTYRDKQVMIIEIPRTDGTCSQEEKKPNGL